MTENQPSPASQRRHLLPRWPSDPVVIAFLVAGAAGAALAGFDLIVGLAPGAVAALVQKVGGHVRAWRGGGVERAFVMESTAISFYVLVCALVVVAALQAAGVLHRVDVGSLAVAALFIDTGVRSARESRFA